MKNKKKCTRHTTPDTLTQFSLFIIASPHRDRKRKKKSIQTQSVERTTTFRKITLIARTAYAIVTGKKIIIGEQNQKKKRKIQNASDKHRHSRIKLLNLCELSTNFDFPAPTIAYYSLTCSTPPPCKHPGHLQKINGGSSHTRRKSSLQIERNHATAASNSSDSLEPVKPES